MSSLIEVRNVSKDFKEVKAVDDLSFSVPQGTVYGFLGQNGAGKSTTIRMLLTLIEPTEGEIEIFGLNLKKHRKEILKKTGAIIEKPDLYKYLTAKENLSIFAAMSGVRISGSELMERLKKVGLAERANSKVKTYSQGMKQRLGIAVALINDPELIILDEPMNGLDPQGIADIRNLIVHLSKDLGKTLLVSSHLLNEMEIIADLMLIIDKGKKVVEGRVAELLNPEQINLEIETTSPEAAVQQIKDSAWKAKFLSLSGGKIVLRTSQEEIPAIVRYLIQKNIDVISVQPRHSLEDYFLTLTAHTNVSTFKN